MEETKVYEVREAIADPSTLGLASLGISLFTLSFFNAGIVDAKSLSVIVPIALVTGLIQLITALYGFRKNEIFTSTAFGIYGMFWFIYAFLQIGLATKLFELDANTLLIFLIAYTIFSFYLLIATLVTNRAVFLIILGLFLVFLLLSLGAALGNDAIGHWAGYVGIVTALVAFYTSAAGLLGTMYGRSVLPVGPFKSPVGPVKSHSA